MLSVVRALRERGASDIDGPRNEPVRMFAWRKRCREVRGLDGTPRSDGGDISREETRGLRGETLVQGRWPRSVCGSLMGQLGLVDGREPHFGLWHDS